MRDELRLTGVAAHNRGNFNEDHEPHITYVINDDTIAKSDKQDERSAKADSVSDQKNEGRKT